MKSLSYEKVTKYLVLLDSKSPPHIPVIIATNKQRVARPRRQTTTFRLVLIGAAIVTPYALLADLDHNTDSPTDHAPWPSSFRALSTTTLGNFTTVAFLV
jgi:hypothetical protein